MPKCKDCGREATEEQVYNAAEKCKDLNAMMQGLTSWQCTVCRTREVAALQRVTPIELASTEDLVKELMKRYDNLVIAFRAVPVQGVNEVTEEIYQRGDYRLCQGLGMGIVNWCERHIIASRDRRLSLDEQQEADDV